MFFCATFLLTVSHNVVPLINNIQRDKIHTKRLRVTNEQVSWTIYAYCSNINGRLIITAPYGSNFVTIPDFFNSR